MEQTIKLDYSDVLIKPQRSALASRNIEVERTFEFPHSRNVWTGVPIIAANMDHTGTIPMLKQLALHNWMTALHKFHSNKQLEETVFDGPNYHLWVTIGAGAKDILMLEETLGKLQYTPNICIDVANGYSEYFCDFVSRVRKSFPRSTIMAGNVATYEQTQQLILSGADIVKIGIGPGSVCTTRKMTGVGYPQFSAVVECADAAHGLDGMICADGGCVVSGDICKAFAGGADFVMLGGMLAGHDECAGDFVLSDGSHIDRVIALGATEFMKEKDIVGIKFHGMSSKEAQEKHYGGVKNYRAPEGKEVVVPYRGPVKGTVLEIMGGIRGCMTLIGAKRLKDIPKRATIVRVNNQLNESFR